MLLKRGAEGNTEQSFEVKEGWRKLHKKKLYTLFSSSHIIRIMKA
jgi:hypothetical protein